MKAKLRRAYRPNSIILQKGYTSTSTRLQIAKDFSKKGMSEKRMRSAILIIYNNENKSGALMSFLEEEVLLPRNTYFKSMKTLDTKDTTYYLIYRCEDSSCSKAALPDQLPAPF